QPPQAVRGLRARQRPGEPAVSRGFRSLRRAGVGGGRVRVVGADGCRAGWVYVALDGEQGWAGGIAPNVRALWRRFQVAELILLDVPIGLKEHGHDERACDVRARRLLGARRSSVFPV